MHCVVYNIDGVIYNIFIVMFTLIGIADPIKFDVSFTDLGLLSNTMATKRKHFETFTAEEI